MAQLADTLHHQLAIGHTIVTAHAATLKQHDELKQADRILTCSIHRALGEYGINLLRRNQLYQSAPQGYWQQIHRFYQLAEQQGLLNAEQTDTEIGDCTIAEAYKRVLLLGCCKPNQLLQSHFSNMLQIFTQWVDKVSLTADNAALLAIDLEADHAPSYAEQLQPGPSLVYLDLSAVVAELQTLSEQVDKLGLVTVSSFSISSGLLQHLIHCWSVQQQRKTKRFEADSPIDLCMGLSATHHFISGELSFEALLSDRKVRNFSMDLDNPFLKANTGAIRKKDLWDSPYEANVGTIDVSLESIQYGSSPKDKGQKTSQPTEKYQHHEASTLNFSATGYCVEWPREVPVQIKPGEIVGLREAKTQQWSIAVIRWAEHQPEEAPQLGLELICPSGAPYGGRILHKKGDDTQYIRVLVLPEVPLLQQPYTLLTPKVPFKEGQKVVLNQQGRELTILLEKKLNATGNYCQFTFSKSAAPLRNGGQSGQQENELDSLWDNL